MNPLRASAVDRLSAHRGRHDLTVLAALQNEYRNRELAQRGWRVPGSLSVVIAALAILLGGLLIAAVLPHGGLF